LWSVLKKEIDTDTDDNDNNNNNNNDGSELSTELSYNETKARRSMLGPSNDNDDAQSQDSNSLLYGTDDDGANAKFFSTD